MKRVTLALAIVVASLALLWDASQFFGGFSLFPGGKFVANLVGFACFPLLALSSAASAVIALQAMWKGYFARAAVLIAVVVVAWLLSPWFLARPVFLLGFGVRLDVSSSPAEIESAAGTCLSLMPSGGRVWGPNKVMGPPEELREASERAWAALKGNDFVRLFGDSGVVFVDPPDVAFTWGGALPGHWGIHVLGREGGQTPSHYLQTLRYTDRIVLFRGH